MTEPEDITRIEAELDIPAPQDWYTIMRLPQPYGPPKPVGIPIRGRDRAEAMRRKYEHTGGTYVLFGAVDIIDVTMPTHLQTYTLLADHLAKGADMIEVEREAIASGIMRANGSLSDAPTDAHARSIIDEMDAWLRLTHGIKAKAAQLRKEQNT